MSIRHKSTFQVNNWKITALVILLAMAIFRLVWIQVRSHTPELQFRDAVSISLSMSDGLSCSVKDPEQLQLLRKNLREPANNFAMVASPGFVAIARHLCVEGVMDLNRFIDLNRVATVVASVFLVFFVRFLTSSWLLAVAVGTGLISRGSLLASHGLISADVYTMMFLSIWFTFLGHFLRTASSFAFFGLFVSMLFLVLLEKAALSILIVIPLLLVFAVVLKRLKNLGRKEEEGGPARGRLDPGRGKGPLLWGYTLSRFTLRVASLLGLRQFIRRFLRYVATRSRERGSVFVTLKEPFSSWVMKDRRWFRVVLSWGTLLIVLAGVVLYLELIVFQIASPVSYRDFVFSIVSLVPSADIRSVFYWLSNHKTYDTYFIIALVAMTVNFLVPAHPRMVIVKETAVLLVVCFLGVVFAKYVSDVFESIAVSEILSVAPESGVDIPFPKSRVLYWFEPVVMALGFSSLYAMYKGVTYAEGKSSI